MLGKTFLALAALYALTSESSALPNAGEQDMARLQGRAKKHTSSGAHPKKHPKHKQHHPHPRPHPTVSATSSVLAQSTSSTSTTTTSTTSSTSSTTTSSSTTPVSTPPPVVKTKIVCRSPSDGSEQSLFNIPYKQYYDHMDLFSNVKHIENGDDYARLSIVDNSLDTVSNTRASPYTTFDLLACTSTYMGYDLFALSRRSDLQPRLLTQPARTVWYGRLVANNMLNMCLSAYKPIAGSDRVAFQLTPCSDDDDDSQVPQFFRTSYDADGNKVVQYVGDRYATTNDAKGLHYNIVAASTTAGCPLGNTIRPDTSEASFYAGKAYVQGA